MKNCSCHIVEMFCLLLKLEAIFEEETWKSRGNKYLNNSRHRYERPPFLQKLPCFYFKPLLYRVWQHLCCWSHPLRIICAGQVQRVSIYTFWAEFDPNSNVLYRVDRRCFLSVGCLYDALLGPLSNPSAILRVCVYQQVLVSPCVLTYSCIWEVITELPSSRCLICLVLSSTAPAANLWPNIAGL